MGSRHNKLTVMRSNRRGIGDASKRRRIAIFLSPNTLSWACPSVMSSIAPDCATESQPCDRRQSAEETSKWGVQRARRQSTVSSSREMAMPAEDEWSSIFRAKSWAVCIVAMFLVHFNSTYSRARMCLPDSNRL